MILPSAEALLLAMAAGLYLYDSSMLIYFNEGVCLPGRRKDDWQLRFGSAHLHLFGKEVFLPNPLLPHRPCYRLAWRLEGRGLDRDCGWTAQRSALKPLAPFVWGIAAGLFVALPLGLFTRLGERALLAALLLTYGNIIIACGWLWLHRAGFGMSASRFAALLFECLVCPPFALNLIRRISRETPVTEDLAVAARRLLTPENWQLARTALVARIDQEIAFADDDVRRTSLLDAHRRNLMKDRP